MKQVIFLIFLLKFSAGNFLDNLEKCKQNDENLNDCLTSTAQKIWPKLVKGDPINHLPSFSPLYAEELSATLKDIITGKLVNATITNFEDIQIQKVTSDLKNKKFEITYLQPTLKLAGLYEADGVIIGLPIKGKGYSETTMFNAAQKYSFTYEIVEKDEKKYVKIINYDLTFDNIEKANFNIKEYETLEDSKFDEKVVAILNENWKEVFEIFRSTAGELLSKLYSAAFQMLFDRISIDQLVE